MMIKGFERGVFIYHSSMTEPFGDLALHLQDCCGGCPYCVECCQRVVDEAAEITQRTAARCTCHIGSTYCKLHNSLPGAPPRAKYLWWSEYMREEGYKEYEECNCTHAAPYCDDCPVCTRNHQRAILARVERESTSYVDIGRSWLRDFVRWLHRRYLQRVQD